jgi:predicted Zn-dependent protease
MPTRLSGTAYGPGFASTGSKIEFDVTDYGISLVTAEAFDGSPPWSDVTVQRQGFNATQVMLEWAGGKGRYAIAVSDPQSIGALAQAAGKIKTAKADGGTRAWIHALVWATLVLPVLLIGLVIWKHDALAGWAVARVPVSEERRIGEMFFSQTKSRLKLVEGEPARLVREVGAKLTQGSAYTYEFYVTEDPSVNAFAMPGGFVVVHTGLLALASTPEEVAGVLAHEVRHVEGRHSLRALVKSAGLSITLAMVFGDAGGLIGMADQLIGLKFSRDHESEADRDGMAALVKAGINPQGMRDFFKKMAAQDKIELGWLSSHPASSERFDRMDAELAKLPAASRNAAPLAYDYAAIKAALPASKSAPKADGKPVDKTESKDKP